MVTHHQMTALSSFFILRKTGYNLVTSILICCLPISVLASALSVHTDRQDIEIGDIITLTVDADFQTSGNQLDLTHLEDQFEVVSKQQSNQIEIINGKFKSRTRWQLQVMPKQIGELWVPPFEINGVKSEPYAINVKKAKPINPDNASYFLTASVNQEKAYVQQEVLYTLQFHFLGNFSGNIRPPAFTDMLSHTLKEQSAYGKTINGKQFTVYEWLYALYPQKSGQIEITGPVFSGIHLYQGQQKGIQLSAQSKTVEVLPVPGAFTKMANNKWLPARALTLTSEWQQSLDNVQQGDSLTRKLTLDIEGLLASQIPTLDMKNNTDFKIYLSQQQTQQTVSSTGVSSQLVVEQTFIPSNTGELTIPTLKLSWFNTEAQHFETAKLAGETITVTAAVSQSTIQPSPFATDEIQHQNQINLDNVSRETNWLWPALVTLLGLAWFITLWLLRRQNQLLKTLIASQHEHNNIAPSNDNPQDAKAQPTILLSPDAERPEQNNHRETNTANTNTLICQQTDLTAAQFYDQLRAHLLTKHSILSFSDLDSVVLKEAILTLEQHLYREGELPEYHLERLCELLLAWEENDTIDKGMSSLLAPLYPHSK